MQPYQHIVAPVDFADTNINVINRAVEVAAYCQASLTFLHVIQDIPLGNEPFGEPSTLILSSELREQQIQHAEERMQLLLKHLQLPANLNVTYAIEEGMAEEAIIHFAREKGMDLIVIGHSGKKGFLGFLGSTADGVEKTAHCDVLVVRIPKHA